VIVQISKQAGKGITMDQPTAEQALKEMEVLVGEWSQTATPAGGEPWPGQARATFEWLEGGQLLLERSTVEMPEAPDGVCVTAATPPTALTTCSTPTTGTSVASTR
jgi:hypothetical protein